MRSLVRFQVRNFGSSNANARHRIASSNFKNLKPPPPLSAGRVVLGRCMVRTSLLRRFHVDVVKDARTTNRASYDDLQGQLHWMGIASSFVIVHLSAYRPTISGS